LGLNLSRYHREAVRADHKQVLALDYIVALWQGRSPIGHEPLFDE
jgi:hypothetical protein